MANGNAKKSGYGLNGRSAFVVAVVSAIFGSISGPVLLVKFGGDSVVAPDRFTGTEGARLEQRVTALEANQSRHFSNHPDQINQFDRRLTTLEAQTSIILNNQSRIIQRLDDLVDR